jgi:hypothetical protein
LVFLYVKTLTNNAVRPIRRVARDPRLHRCIASLDMKKFVQKRSFQ